MDEIIAGDAQVDLLFTNKDKLIGEIIIDGSFGCGGYEMEEFKIPRGEKRKWQVADYRPWALEVKNLTYSRNW